LIGGVVLFNRPTTKQKAIVAGARSCLGDLYDSSEYEGGPPPEGRGACTDVVYNALLSQVDLQKAVAEDVAENPELYPDAGNADLDFRWCPTLVVWFRRHAESLPTDVNLLTVWSFEPGDVVFYDDGGGGFGHVGVVSDRRSWDGLPLLIHNPAPVCVEENALTSNRIVGHFRL